MSSFKSFYMCLRVECSPPKATACYCLCSHYVPSSLWLACTHLQPYHLHQLADTKSIALFCVWACAPFVCSTAALARARRPVRVHTVFLYDKVGVLEASDGSQTLALLYLMLRWQLLTEGIHTCVYNLSYSSKQTRYSGHLLPIQYDMTQTEGCYVCLVSELLDYNCRAVYK